VYQMCRFRAATVPDVIIIIGQRMDLEVVILGACHLYPKFGAIISMPTLFSTNTYITLADVALFFMWILNPYGLPIEVQDIGLLVIMSVGLVFLITATIALSSQRHIPF